MKAFKLAAPFCVALTMVACGGTTPATESNAKPSSQPASTTTATETPAETNASSEYVSPLPDDAPVYNAGMTLNSPYHFNDEFGKSVGFDVDILRAIGEEEGFKVNFNNMEFVDMFPALEEGTMDILLSGLSLTPERKGKYAASLPYSHGKAGYMIKSDSPYSSKEDLNDKKIGVIGGSNLAKMVSGKTDAVLVEKPTLFLAFQTIFTGESDAVFGFEPNMARESAQFPEQEFKFIAFSKDVSTAMYANKKNQELMDKVNAGFEKIRENGKYQKISEKWFGDKASHFTVQ